jgi:Copper amine oxidase N-terminal domain
LPLEPVRHYRRPTYPTRIELELDPEILRRIPERWRGHPVVVAMLAALWASGCHDRASESSTAGSASSTTTEKTPSKRSEREAVSKVAPLFEHGDGTASTGGVSATSMVFLTEEDAMRVVLDEAAKAGLMFNAFGTDLYVDLPRTTLSGKPTSRFKGRLWLDGYDYDRKIGFEIVSREDFAAWGEEPSNSTATTYNLKATAEALREGIDHSTMAGTYGVFYDPMVPVVSPPSLSEGTFDEATRAPLRAFRPTPEGYRVQWGGKRIRFEVDSAVAEVNGAKVKMHVPATLRGNAMYVPVKFVTETLGGKVVPSDAGKRISVEIPAAGIQASSSVRQLDFGGTAGPGTIVLEDADREARAGPTLERSREELRAQVRDFIAWLKGQGVI